MAWHPAMPPIGTPSECSQRTQCKESNGPCRENSTFSPTSVSPSVRYPVCLRPSKDVVTDYVALHGSWSDCAILPALYFATPDRRAKGKSLGRYLFFDVGSNVGACTFEMLVRIPEARVIAVEPSPQNLFYLSRSLVRLATAMPSVLARVLVLPTAVGNSSSQGQSISLKTPKGQGDNLGASEVSPRTVSSDPRTMSTLWSLDRLVDSSTLREGGSLMKMDVQGSECHALEGMSELLATIGVIKTEVAPTLMARQGCQGPKSQRKDSHHRSWEALSSFAPSADEPPLTEKDSVALGLIQQLRMHGFDVEDELGKPVNSLTEAEAGLFKEKKYKVHGNADIIALRKNINAGQRRHHGPK
eukprot:CAMPEP_0185760782 /NCGR_PEP_ID=MMETSP1174-20130828/19703_1 /TAXON_ID=35687 /ORGANISM="Dictyocha speculum, Strain CCMP1381" /LENGTH=357 /DNA_ID=CAMNT_0028441747 /DNA_START=162 /DNA_END=1235 /DNA_ORIENTATION=+